VTQRNKLLGSVLSVLIVAGIIFWIYSVIRIGMGPCEFLDRLFVRARAHRFPVLQLPEVDLDVFKVCIYKRWRLGEVLYVNLLIAFGTLSSSSPKHKLTSGVPMMRHRRCSFLLDHFGEGQEISDE